MKSRIIKYAFVGFLSLFLFNCSSKAKLPKNIILMISDGCGYNQILCTDYYQYGKANSQVYAKFPVVLGMSTYPVDGQVYDSEHAWKDLDWAKNRVTDSAAAGTAMATGNKTINKRIGVDENKQNIQTILELAESVNKATGVVTTVPLSHATPASFVAHHSNRNDYEIIAKQMLAESSVDVIIGCGHPGYDQNGDSVPLSKQNYKYVGGKDLWNQLLNGIPMADADGDGIKDAWHLIQDRQDFQKYMKGETPSRLLGIPEVRSTLNQGRDGDKDAAPFEILLNETVPTLAEMTQTAINVLDEDPDGYFLMIEGGAIDWTGHANQLGRMIEEEIDFNHAVEAVVEWVETNSSWDETLLIVTADHETGYLTGPLDVVGNKNEDEAKEWNPIKNPGKGNLPEVVWHSTSHSNHLVPFFAKGQGSELFVESADKNDPVRGAYIDNIDIGQNVFLLWK